MQAISTKSLSKRFGPKQALAGVSLDVPQGTIFGFLGPNGAGKTTTIRCLMDYIRPTSGSVLIFGKDTNKDGVELKRSIGYLSSDMQLNQKWTGEDHLRLFEGIKGKGGLARNLVRRLQLDINTPVKDLSSGNKQKLAVALAFVGDPKLLIMDEPTRGLDPLLQNELYDILREFREGDKTVFLSSHNLSEVQRLCDEVALIKDGRVVETKTMADIRDMKIHLVTVSFAREVPDSGLSKLGEIVSQHSREVVLKVHGDMNPLMKRLAGLDLADITIDHASLEDIFLEQYRS